MGTNTKIAWCDSTFNIAFGCVKVSPGCDNCYAEIMDKRTGGKHWGVRTERRILSENYWKQPLKWNRQAQKEGRRAKVFCSSMCDIFENHPTITQERQKLWKVIMDTPHLDWMLLTKRARRIQGCLPAGWGIKGVDSGMLLPYRMDNVWLGVSIESMKFAWRADCLRGIPAVVRFISYEPALGPLHEINLQGIDLVIYGGESGPGFRPDDPQWALDIYKACQDSGTAFFYKQQAARTPGSIGPVNEANQIRQFPIPLLMRIGVTEVKK